MPVSPFTIDTMATPLQAAPAQFRQTFGRDCSLVFEEPFSPGLLSMLMKRAANASFIDDDVEYIGKREIEAPQRVGGTISLLLARQAFLQWVAQATGRSPLRAVAGRLVQTRAGSPHALTWHNDLNGAKRMLGVVINLSDAPFTGGEFELRRVGSEQPFLAHRYERAGSMMIFAVGQGLEHRVTEVGSGGPRRVFAGWFLSEPEHGESATPVAVMAGPPPT